MDDYINKQAAINAICEFLWQKDRTLIGEAIDALKELPSENVNPSKNAHWETIIIHGSKKKVECSNCGLMSYKRSYYCPNCGARMDEGSDNDNHTSKI